MKLQSWKPMLSSRDDALFILGFVLPCSAPGGSAVQISPMDFLEWKVQMRTLIMMNHVSVSFPPIFRQPHWQSGWPHSFVWWMCSIQNPVMNQSILEVDWFSICDLIWLNRRWPVVLNHVLIICRPCRIVAIHLAQMGMGRMGWLSPLPWKEPIKKKALRNTH